MYTFEGLVVVNITSPREDLKKIKIIFEVMSIDYNENTLNERLLILETNDDWKNLVKKILK